MSGGRVSWLERPLTRTVGLLAILAYVPALTAAPGRMPSDSKLYLYLDPGRFLGDAASTFDGRQFAGWVPHQHVAYLWPSGPWFWFFETIGVPDWIAHRWWIGTLMIAAGLGVRWCARLLGLTPVAAAVAAVVYQLTLYVLPYVSRTSVMLLPWAGLGWIVALSVRATRRNTWGDPAAIALVVLTVGAVNATALAMIVPGPALWLVHSGWQRTATWRQVGVVALRTAVLATAVSLWWIVMLVVQGRYGTDVLPYSESLADVSLTANASEVWRSLGYWLFYVRDPYAATTTESLRYLSSSPAIVVSYLLPIVCLGGLVFVRWQHRRFAALLVATGIVLSVGVHPVDDRSPLMRLIAGDDESGLALALRSSTRALPLLVLGLALAAAASVTACAGWRLPRLGWPGDRAMGAVIIVLAVANLPSLWTGAFVDPALERDQDPPQAWFEAAADLDRSGTAGRVLQLPGQEFGAYRWGYTVDQPLPGLTEKPLVTRDLLPLGSPGAMDLLTALDDRVQAGTFEPESLAGVARLLGVDTIWVTNDSAFDRFRTARPEVVDDLVATAPGVGRSRTFGELFLNRPDVPFTDERALGDPRVGQPQPTVTLHDVEDPGSVVRVVEDVIVVSGSGDGLVDASAAGLIDGSAGIRYSASLTGDDLTDALDRATALVVTDSNRDRARHWRSSQDTTGYTEPGGPRQDVLTPVPADQRLPVFESAEPRTQTIAEQRGPVVATATAYGEPFAYLPEHRPYLAVDGDPTTAWVVGEHGDPLGESIRLTFDEPTDGSGLRLFQATDDAQRHITEVSVVARGSNGTLGTESVALDAGSRSENGQLVPLPRGTSQVDLVIDGLAGGAPATAGAVAGVGFAEIDAGLGPTGEIVRPPHDALDQSALVNRLTLVFSRLRADPMNRWRDDPEHVFVREFDLPTARSLTTDVTVRVDARAADATLADLFGWPVVASGRLTGSLRNAGVAAFDGDRATAWISSFDSAVGSTLAVRDVDRPVDRITIRQPVSGFTPATAVTVASAGESRTVALEPDAAGGSVATLDPPLAPGTLSITVAEVEPGSTTIDRRYADPVVLPVAFTEVEFEGAPSVPVIGSATTTVECAPLVTVGDRVIGVSFTVEGDDWLDGAPVTSAVCDPGLDLDSGTHLVTAGRNPFGVTVDRIVFDAGDVAATPADPARVTVLDRGRFDRTVEVRGCVRGCWLVVGEGHSEAWTATTDGDSLGEPTIVDGGFNGWWVDPTDEVVVVDVRWTAQRSLSLALLASLLGVVVAIALVVVDRLRHRCPAEPAGPRPVFDSLEGRVPHRAAVLTSVAWIVAPALLIGPSWAAWGAIGAVVVWVTRRRRLAELVAVAGVIVVGAGVTILERRDAPLPNGGWPTFFESLHGLGMFAMACLLVGALVADDASDERCTSADAAGHYPRPM